MTPETHTFWDPEKGRYVTIPLASVIKPPTDDAELRRKSVVAVDAVVSSAMSGITKGFLWTLGFLILCAIWLGSDLHKIDTPWDWALKALTHKDFYKASTPEVHLSDAEIRRQNDIALAKLHTH
jgi:hypothetical protein